MQPLRNPNPAGAGAAPLNARRDVRRREIVDDGISLLRVVGTMPALEYLKSHSIDPHVIARVLMEPARRRGAESSKTAWTITPPAECLQTGSASLYTKTSE